MSNAAVGFAPVGATTGDPIRLAMQRLWLTGHVLPAGARLTVQHVFRSAEDKPLEVIYSFALPRDAALRAFRITGDGFEAHSELKSTEDAVKAYEQGIAEGSLSTLARQYGDGLVNLTVGNIRPNELITVYLDVLTGVELRDDGFRFRFPFTLAPAYHARMRAAIIADGEGEVELPTDEFGDMILPRFREDASSLHEVGFDLSVLHQLAIDEVGSPSHSIRVKQDGAAPARVALASEKDIPNRDLVLDVRFKEATAQVLAGSTDDGKKSFAAIVPSTLFGLSKEEPRRTVIVLDRSGSMQGAPIAQARKAIEACLAALEENDSFGVVAFDDEVESMNPSLLSGSQANREKARAFLSQVDARGGTKLADGFLEAARMLAGGGDVLILTDGQVAGTERILAQARAANIRIFCLGIGSASLDRFLSLLARETGGVSRFLTARERVDLAAVDLFASIGRPVASGLKASGNVSPEPPTAVFAGAPVILFGQTEGAPYVIELTWDGGGRLSLPVPTGDSETGKTLRLLQGSRLITDWESRYPSEEALAPLEKRQQSRVATHLKVLSQTYGLASREMSLVAVVKRAGDRTDELPETRVVPVGIPQDTKFGAYFGAVRGPSSALLASAVLGAPTFGGLDLRGIVRAVGPPPSSPTQAARGSSRLGDAFRNRLSKVHAPKADATESKVDILLDLASQLEADGGMPGESASVRAARSVAAVLAFVAEGHTIKIGALRLHVARLVAFLESIRGTSDRERLLIDSAIEAASNGNAPAGNWLALARSSDTPWKELEKAMTAGAR